MESPSAVELFLESVPEPFLKDVLTAVFDCYAAANQQCESFFEPPEALNLRPFVRRGLIEQSLREVSKGYPGVSATSERGLIGENGQTSWWSHTLVRCGVVAFTENTVGDPNELVRPSQFRQGYAASNRQLLLFALEEALGQTERPPVMEGVKLYGILLHGQSPDAGLPGFAVVRFPNYEYDGYLTGSVDLFARFPAVVASRTKVLMDGAVEVEQVSEPTPRLRLGRSTKGTGA
jgi:hypothetical protein